MEALMSHEVTKETQTTPDPAEPVTVKLTENERLALLTPTPTNTAIEVPIAEMPSLPAPIEPYLEDGIPVFGIALALGDIYPGAGCADEPYEPVDGAVTRYLAVVRHRPDLPVICTAGFSKENPTVPCTARMSALCEQLKSFLMQNRPTAADKLYDDPLTWGTRGEVTQGIMEAIRLRLADPSEPTRLVIATNPSHLIRVWLCCMKLKPKPWKVEMHIAWHSFTWRSKLREIPATIIELCRFLRFWKNERVG